MVKKVVERTMKKENVTFYPDDSIDKVFVPEKEIDHPFIFYTLLSRTPRSKNIKPRFREDITDRNAKIFKRYLQVIQPRHLHRLCSAGGDEDLNTNGYSSG